MALKAGQAQGLQTYDQVAEGTSRELTRRYSTSFGLAIRLFAPVMRPHIYNIYGLARIADEIVDTYRGPEAGRLLDELEREVETAARRGYSSNLVVHAFARTARECGIGPELTAPFFESMRMDLRAQDWQPDWYERYIYGSAEVVGLMCLRVFCRDDTAAYARLERGARALGAAFQKVNFLRDLAEDHEVLGRYYFPIGSYDGFDEATKQAVVRDIERDFKVARPAIGRLPAGARPAVAAACHYYEALLAKLKAAPADGIKRKRVRVANSRKLALLAGTYASEKLRGTTGRTSSPGKAGAE